jgi:RNA polymerase sigma factor (sigma-70 family)
MVFSECYSVTKSRHDAEDAAQATFLTLAVQAKTGDEIRHLGPWLQRVARRVALDQEKAKRRRRKREDNHHRVNGSSGLATPERLTMDQLELRHLISEELQALPARYRMPLVLHYFGGMTREQMAAELKCKPATLGVRLFRAREMLGKRLAKRGVMLPAVALPIAIAMVVRESVEQHGVLSMAATAEQIARAASHVAAGLPMGHGASGGLSPTAMSLVDHATRDLVLRKVKAIVAAAAIGASALAAGSAEVVRKINNGTLTIPSLFDVNGYFRFLKSPELPRLRVDASQTIRGPQLAFDGGSPLGNLGLSGPGQLDLVAVSLAAPTGSGTTSSSPPSAASASISGGPGGSVAKSELPASVRPFDIEQGGTVLAAAKSGPDAKAESSTSIAAATSPSSSASASSGGGDGSDEALNLPLLAASFIGGGGGGGGASASGGLFVLNPLPPLNPSNASKYGLASSSPDAFGSVGSVSSSNISNTGGVLRGWGKVAFTGTFDMNGVVIADGYGQQKTLDLSSVASVTHTILNSPSGINGWYAQDGGKLVLPATPISAGTTTFTWGDATDKTTLDLVNSARLTLYDALTSGTVSIALLAPNRSEVPAVPAGYDVQTIWNLTTSVKYGSLDITARYGLAGADLIGATSGLGVYYYDNGKWNPAPDSGVDISHRLITALDLPPTAYIALFTSHGKAMGGLTALTSGSASSSATDSDDQAAVVASGVSYAPVSLSDILDSAAGRAAYASSLCPVSSGDAAADLATYASTAGTTDADGAASGDSSAGSGSPTTTLTLTLGGSLQSGASPQGVPEPGGLVWACLSLPLLARRRRSNGTARCSA